MLTLLRILSFLTLSWISLMLCFEKTYKIFGVVSVPRQLVTEIAFVLSRVPVFDLYACFDGRTPAFQYSLLVNSPFPSAHKFFGYSLKTLKKNNNVGFVSYMPSIRLSTIFHITSQVFDRKVGKKSRKEIDSSLRITHSLLFHPKLS